VTIRDVPRGLQLMTWQDWLFCLGVAVSLALMFWGLLTLVDAL
jgi:hypothetical protein